MTKLLRFTVIIPALTFVLLITSCDSSDYPQAEATQAPNEVLTESDSDTPPTEEPRELGFHEDFPTIIIYTEGNPFSCRERWRPGTITIESEFEVHRLDEMGVEARGRGNSTWWGGEDKRPLRLRLERRYAMPGSQYEARRWILLANHFDKSMMRNFGSYYLAGLLDGMEYAPMTQFVHLYANGVYMGVYMLTDERNTGPGRAQLHLDSDPAVSEYMLELCGRFRRERGTTGVDYVRISGISHRIRLPDSTSAHAEYVYEFMSRLDQAIRGHDYETVLQYIDLPSFVDFYIVQEFFKNPDVGWSSVFMQIKGQGEDRRLHMGPIWDFDLAAGNTTLQDDGRFYFPGEYGYSPIGLTAATRNHWYRYLMGIPEFFDAVRDRWHEVRDDQIAQTLWRIADLTITFQDDFERNFERHQILGTNTGSNPDNIVAIESFKGHVAFLLEFLTIRKEWLDEFFAY